jgi:RNA-directed DNA polymerase
MLMTFMGVSGSYKDAKVIKQSIEDFLKEELSLETSPEKTDIKLATKGISFLGYNINMEYGKRTLKMKVNGRVCRKRTIRGQILLSIPKEKIIEFISHHDYGIWDTNESKHRGYLISSSNVEIISIYNSELRGFSNYYCLARNGRKDLGRLMLITHGSLVKTLAGKYKTLVSKVFAQLKHGNQLTHSYYVNGKQRTIVVYSLENMKAIRSVSDNKPLTSHYYRAGTELTKRMMSKQCEYCGRTDKPTEVHHINKLKDLKTKTTHENWEKVMIARDRKTLILCAGSNDSCHYLLHQGKLPDMRNWK